MQRFNNKRDLVVSELMESPVVIYPPRYRVSSRLYEDELLHESIRAVHMCAFEMLEHPESFDALFGSYRSGCYPIYKERYVTAYFGGKIMYLQMQGWKSLPATEDIFQLANWLI